MVPMRPNEINYLTGRLSDAPLPPWVSLEGRGGKFTTDGRVQIWPGNTFICHVDRNSQAFEALCALQAELKTSSFQKFFTFLPPESFHMTVFQGVSPIAKPGSRWPAGLAQDFSRDEVTNALLGRVDGIALPQRHRMRVAGLFGGCSLTMEGATEDEEKSLRETRIALRDATGIDFADFDDYVFHITLAYLLEWVPEATAQGIAALGAELMEKYKDKIGPVDLGPVEFCNFDNMHHFEPVKLMR